MAYNRLNLSSGDIFKADHLKHIEDGIENFSKQLVSTKFDYNVISNYQVVDSNYLLKENGAYQTSSSDKVYVFTDFDVTDDLYVSGYAPNSTGKAAVVCYYDESNIFINSEYGSSFGSSASYNKIKLTIPSNAKTIKIGRYQNIETILYKYEEVETDIDLGMLYSSFMLTPTVEMGGLNGKGEISDYNHGRKYYRTPKFLEVKNKSISVVSSLDCQIQIMQYDSGFTYLKALAFVNVASETKVIFSLDDDCKFVRLLIRKDSSTPEFNLPSIKVSNVADKEYFNPRPSDDGYLRLVIPINVANPASVNDTTWNQQDTPNWLADYGLLALPETYSNIGKPTRLIIYCHGSGVYYTSNSTRFPSTDFRPEYWLAEGYAVMDMDGNPLDDTHAHIYTPTARQSYELAYKWVIENFNIATDGVFLGGRSLGGGMCFDIMQSHIPVIAACPVVPSCNTLFMWNIFSNTTRQYMARRMGFVGEEPTWTTSKPMTAEEYQYIKDNFDKMVQYSPFWRGIENLPDKEILFSVGLKAATVRDYPEEAELYNSLRFKVSAPVKIFDAYEDGQVPYERNALYMYRMLTNAGQICELRMFHTDAPTPHKFELGDSRAMIEVTTTYGKTMSAPLVYVEMLQFWRRYE